MTSVYKQSYLLVVEGQTEAAFVKYLQGCFGNPRSKTKVVQIKNAFGGTPTKIVKKAFEYISCGDYDNAVIVMDLDRTWPTKLKIKNRSTSIEYLGFTPCIEGFYLGLLRFPGFDSSSWSSSKCKRVFEETYLNKKDKQNPKAYHSIFPKSTLRQLSSNSQELTQLIEFVSCQ